MVPVPASQPLLPPRLRPGDQVRVVAPAASLSCVGEEVRERAAGRLAGLGLQVTYGEGAAERDVFESSSVQTRVADLHAAFADPEVAAVLTALGGFNSNQLLPALDYELIGRHPKVFCGYSDITALHNAVLARSGLVGYHGPHFANFGMRDHFEGTLESFVACLFSAEPVTWAPSPEWTNDAWFLDQDDRHPVAGDGWWTVQPGEAAGRIVGGNLCTYNLLQGTAYRPTLDGAVLFIEDDHESRPANFDRDLTSVLQLPDAAGLAGLVIGRFERATGMTRDVLQRIVGSKPELAGLPVLANVDFGHTDPVYTFPVGGECSLVAAEGSSVVTLTRH